MEQHGKTMKRDGKTIEIYGQSMEKHGKKEVKTWCSKVFYGKSMVELRNNYGKPMKKHGNPHQHLKVKHGKTMEDS